MDVPRTKICLDTSILVATNMDRREYHFLSWHSTKSITKCSPVQEKRHNMNVAIIN
jgi:hypothetical protein